MKLAIFVTLSLLLLSVSAHGRPDERRNGNNANGDSSPQTIESAVSWILSTQELASETQQDFLKKLFRGASLAGVMDGSGDGKMILLKTSRGVECFSIAKSSNGKFSLANYVRGYDKDSTFQACRSVPSAIAQAVSDVFASDE